MKAFMDARRTLSVTPNTELRVNQKVWFELKADGLDEKKVSLLTESCYATSDPSPSTHLKYDLIRNGCANPSDNIIVIESNGQGLTNYFSFNMFQFNGNSKDIYLHCRMNLCLKSDNSCTRHLRDHDRITNDDSEEEEKTAEEKQMGMMQHSFPMVQVAGHDGPSVVYRPWTIKDMKEMMNDHLPDIQQDGEKFSTALLLLCQQFSPTMPEIRKLLTLKIGPTHASHFTQQMAGLHHMTKVEWENPANDGYRNAITTLCTAIKAKFPAKVDMSKITACKQNPEELVNDYYHRLHLVFTANSDIQEPDGYSAGAVGVWETHLSNAFLNGLSSAISTSVRASCIGVMDGARLEEIRRHAIHAEKRLSEDKASDDKKRSDRKEKAQLTMSSNQGLSGDINL
ncbi:Alpha-tectorin [Dissostichus eleginoides]|uniref:Alpha-tectorin n=1 Tax=Dissostichus eleginoides TaxID=100907 RepID=A0AAD9CIL0_DISEL|nr:Alpha-tectorin [Dissostichus eleginoides]